MESVQPEHPDSDAAPATMPPVASVIVPAPRRGNRCRLGPWLVPSAAIAWGISIAAHAAVMVAGIVVLRSARHEAAPGIALSRGDGGDDGAFFFAGGGASASSAPDSLVSDAPPVAPGDREAGTPEAPASPLAGEQSPAWDSVPDPIVTLAEPETSDVGLIGLSPPSTEFPQPVRRTGGTGVARPASDSDILEGGRVGNGAAAGPVAGPGAGRGEGSDSPGVPGGIADHSLPAPVYPRQSRLRGEQGTVVVEVSLDADGTASLLRVVDDAGFPRLAEAALAAVKKARFRPAFQDGRPVACIVRIPFRFRLRAGQ